MESETRVGYFLDTKIMPVMAQWITALGLETWKIDVTVTRPFNGAWAVCWCSPEEKLGRIAFSDQLLDKVYDDQLLYIVGHELIHMLVEPAMQVVEASVPDAILAGFREQMEGVVNRTTAIVGRAYKITPFAVP